MTWLKVMDKRSKCWAFSTGGTMQTWSNQTKRSTLLYDNSVKKDPVWNQLNYHIWNMAGGVDEGAERLETTAAELYVFCNLLFTCDFKPPAIKSPCVLHMLISQAELCDYLQTAFIENLCLSVEQGWNATHFLFLQLCCHIDLYVTGKEFGVYQKLWFSFTDGEE